MKPSHSIVPVALLCGLLSASEAVANPQDGLRLAQGAPPQADDKNGGGDKDNKGKDHGKGQDKKDQGGKGPERGPERGPRERKGDHGPGPNGGNGPPQRQERQQQQKEAPKLKEVPPPRQEEHKAPPPKQPEFKPVPKVETPVPKFTPPPPKVEEKKGPPPGASQGNGPDNKGRDRDRFDRNGDRDRKGPDRGGPDQKGQVPKSETKGPDQKGPPPSNGGNGAPKVDNKPAFTPPQGPPKGADRKDDDYGGHDQKGQEPKSETKGPDQKGPPPSNGGNGAQQPDSKPAFTPPQGPPKGADRKDDDRRDADRKNGDRGDNNRKDWDRKDGDRGGPPSGDAGRPERGRWSGGKPAAPSEAHDINDLKSRRKEHSEDGGKRVIIEEPDKRRIVREGGRSIIRHDETERFRRIAPDTRIEKRNGLDISVTLLPGGIRIFTDLDNEGRTLRRYRRGPDGRDVILFDNRDYYRRSRGGSFLDAIIDLPPPRLRIPRERYIVDYDRASDEDIYEALDAGPVDDLDRGYSLEEVRRSPMLRDRMRRIDLDTVNFEFGSWTVDYNQYGTLERVARAMNRIIDRNPGEMFLIEGHTDAVGSDDDNLSLSDRRAESVAIILTEEFGVPPENLTTQGYGEQYLKVPTDGPERINRRVAVRRITPLLAR